MTEEGRQAVGEVFRELAGLERFEVLRNDGRSMRYARDGSSRVVQWGCKEEEGGAMIGRGM